jgi:hypothetical protein
MTGFGIENEEAPKSADAGMIARIRALLAKAEGTDNDAERDAFTAKAANMSAKYGVDAAGSADDDMTLKEYNVTGDFARQAGELIYWVAEALGCRAVMTFEGVAVLGYASDVARCDILATCLGLQMNSSAAKVDGPYRVVEGWMLGFTTTAVSRLRDAEARARSRMDAGLLAARKAKVDEVFGQEFPATSKGKSRRGDLSGYAAGANAGRTADIGQSRMQNRRAIG